VLPDWPLNGQTDREAQLWDDLWRRPQAVMWQRLGQWYEVAMFCRMLARAEEPRSSVELQKVVRQYLDSLGLSTAGMLRNRWRLAEPEPAVQRAAGRAAPRRKSARSRLTVVAADAAPES
jgi:hypothetical protein